MNKDEAREAAWEANHENAHIYYENGFKHGFDAGFDAGAASVDRRAIVKLLQERLTDHSFPDSGEYNGCDDSPCNWCERALKTIAEIEGDYE